MGRVKKLKKLLRRKEIEETLRPDKPKTATVEQSSAGEGDANVPDVNAEILSTATTPHQDGSKKSTDKTKNAEKSGGVQKTPLKLSKKKQKQLLKILEKKQKKVNREELVAKLTKLKKEASRNRKELAKEVDVKSLRKRKAPNVQHWGRGVRKDKERRPDVLGIEDEDTDEDDDDSEDEDDEEHEERNKRAADAAGDSSEATDQLKTTNEDDEKKMATKLSMIRRRTAASRAEDGDDDMPDVNATLGHLKPRNTKQPVVLNRPPEISEHRSALPIISMEQEIMETIETNPVTVICGETGSGKTTQVAQFLYEAGYAREGLIGVTEPRRVAAISMSKRVAYETGLGEKVVSYQVRFDGNCTPETRIKFLTDGVLLKEMESDLSLSNYSVIIVDEAHERSVHSDVAIGLLSRVVGLRERKGKPLRVIVMSATLRVSDFTQNERLFKKTPPVINVQSRQFPVTIHFNRTTPKDYMADAFKKVCKIHKNLPPGGILVFVTGRLEVNQLVGKLRRRFAEGGRDSTKGTETTGAAVKNNTTDKSMEVEVGSKEAKRQDEEEQEDDNEDQSSSSGESSGDSDNGTCMSPLASSVKETALAEEEEEGRKSRADPSGCAGQDEESTAVAESCPSSAKKDAEQSTVTTIDIARASAPDDDGGLNLENYSIFPLEDGELDEKTEERNVPDNPDRGDDEDVDQEVLEEESDIDDDLLAEECRDENVSPMKVLPMFAMLPSQMQQKIFDRVPEGTRLCVVATNVAETSLTIPGVRYVIDTGKCKTRVYDRVTGISKFIVSWTSKASAEQRAGRAGRQGPGHCYRLYSSAVYTDKFIDFSPAEVTLRPVEGLLLQMKCMGIEKVVNFPFPSPPPREALTAAENSLVEMRALKREKVKPLALLEREAWLYSSTPTPLGRAMSLFPVAPRFAKMLALSHQHRALMPYVVALVAGLAVQEPFVKGNVKWPAWCKSLGDMGRLLAAVGAAEFDTATPRSPGAPLHSQQLRAEAQREIRKLRYQLTEELNLLVPDLQLTLDPCMPPPNPSQMLALRQLVLSACVDRVARKKSGKVYESMQTEGAVYLHGDSVVFKNQPPWLVYQEITEEHGDRMQLRMVCPIEPSWLPVLAPQQCVLSEPLDSPAPEYNERDDVIYVWVQGTYGPLAWQLDKCRIKAPEHWPERFNWFAKAFLDAQVIKLSKECRTRYVAQSTIVVKKYSAVSQRASDLVGALKSANVCSRADLVKKWKTEPMFLLRPYLSWLPEELHGKIKLSWPPVK